MTRIRTQLFGAFVSASMAAIAHAQGVVKSPDQNAAQVEAHWTSARKASVRPMPLRVKTGTPAAAPAALLHSGGAPGLVGGNLPAGASADGSPAAIQVENQQPTFGAGSTVWYNYPSPSTLAIPVLDYFVVPSYPNTALGKLFFSGPGGNFVCSAQSVTSSGTWGAGNRQTVITAGHCCSDGAGTFYSNWRFEPAHRNGVTPLGAWTAGSATVFTAWHTASDLTRDYCVLQMHKRNGQNINDAAGALGYAWNQPLPQNYVATGWPAAAPFTGGLLYYAMTSDAETDTNHAAPSFPYTHGVGNVMTGGSSGGAWLLKYQSYVAGPGNLFNGLNSYKYTTPARPNEMFGPYIDDVFVTALLQAVATAPALP